MIDEYMLEQDLVVNLQQIISDATDKKEYLYAFFAVLLAKLYDPATPAPEVTTYSMLIHDLQWRCGSERTRRIWSTIEAEALTGRRYRWPETDDTEIF